MPAISVIVPVYKVEPYLRRCVDSILEQTFSDFELILVDDGSPDKCPAICDEYKKKDSRVHVIHQENGGLSAARNAGIDWAFANSNSQWLTLIDSDDWVHPEMLSRLLDAACKFNANISICSYLQTDGSKFDSNADVVDAEIWKTEEFFVEYNINATIACAKLYNKSCFESIRFPLGKLHEDEFTTYRVLFKCDYISFIATPMYYYFTNPNGIMASPWTMARMATFDAFESQIAYFDNNGFKSAHRALIRRYLYSITERICTLSRRVPKNREVLRALKKRKQKNFKKYSKRLDLNDDRDAWILTKIYPKRMWLYWHIKALAKKLKIGKE